MLLHLNNANWSLIPLRCTSGCMSYLFFLIMSIFYTSSSRLEKERHVSLLLWLFQTLLINKYTAKGNQWHHALMGFLHWPWRQLVSGGYLHCLMFTADLLVRGTLAEWSLLRVLPPSGSAANQTWASLSSVALTQTGWDRYQQDMLWWPDYWNLPPKRPCLTHQIHLPPPSICFWGVSLLAISQEIQGGGPGPVSPALVNASWSCSAWGKLDKVCRWLAPAPPRRPRSHNKGLAHANVQGDLQPQALGKLKKLKFWYLGSYTIQPFIEWSTITQELDS